MAENKMTQLAQLFGKKLGERFKIQYGDKTLADEIGGLTMTAKGFQAIDLVVFELSNAIQIAKNSTEFYTDDFKKVSAVKKPVEISIKSADFILGFLQKYKRSVDDNGRD